MKLFRKKQKDESPIESPSDKIVLTPSEEEEILLEQKLSPPPTLEVRGEVSSSELSVLFMEYQMTIQPKVELTGKDASILLMICNVSAVSEGIDFTLYLTLEYLYLYLLKGYKKPLEYPFEKGKQSLLIAELILVATRGLWLSLGEREHLPQKVRQGIIDTGWLPNKSTLLSWMQYRSPQKYFKVRTVRLDSFLENERNSERYSSYTKGYGEGGKLSRVQRTPFSAELDGDSSERETFSFSLIEINQYNYLLNLVEEFRKPKEE
jgi:hypothetical protein